jgi:hypothetical protein
MIDAATRLHGVEQLIDEKQYFVIHAARQSGKTTYLYDLTERINAAGKYYALYCSLEGAQGTVEPEKGIPAVISCIKDSLSYTDIPHADMFAKTSDLNDYISVLKASISSFCTLLDRPLVIFFDEADCLSEGTLIAFLRQLREGYNRQDYRAFVHSIALVGMRNIRDYKARVRPESDSLGSASPFNIVTETFTLKNFTREEIAQLYRQHTDETGQVFEEDAVNLVWEQTQGQPWLVNAVAREAIVKLLQSDSSKPVTSALIGQAIQNIILSRPTHIDNLLERLKEERVRRIIEPVILGKEYISRESDDFLYVKDMGMVRVVDSRVQPANPIYAEAIIRKLSADSQDDLLDPKYPYRMPRYLKGGVIDMDYLVGDFQQFWRENSDIWIKRFEYHEAAPHLVMMAFLQRVVNGGGQIIREMASGTGRLDLCLIYENRKYPVELKIRYGDESVDEGIEQIMRYMGIYGCSEGWLLIFDRRSTVGWDDKIYTVKKKINGKTVTVVGL